MNETLNTSQLEAVHYLNGPLLVLAGAGSGKTKVITQKISYLIQVCGIAPEQIVAVTFTNKAAREMKERATSAFKGKRGRGLSVSTFHTLGLKFIKTEFQAFGFKPNISIFDTEDCLVLLRELLCNTSDEHKEKLEIYLKHISRWKGMGLSPEQSMASAKNAFESQCAMLYEQYQRHLKTYNAVDFDDLILLPLQLLRNNPEIREKWQNRVRYLLVDEYQDTNTSQYELIRHFAGVQGRFTVVGDDHQSIYTFRGARPDNLLDLTRDYPNLKVIKLEQNYRSTGTILKAANHLINFNPSLFSKNLWSTFSVGDPIRILYAEDEEQEATRVVSQLLSHKFQEKTPFSNYAILYRSNHQSRIFEKALREHQIPYQLSGGTSFFSRTEVKDLLAYFKLLVNPDDDCAFLRIVNTPKREIGPATLEKLSLYATSRNIPLFEASFEIGLEQHLPHHTVEKIRHFTHWINLMSDNAKRGDALAVVKELVKTIQYDTWIMETSNTPHAAERRMENVNELLAWLERLLKGKQTQENDFNEAPEEKTLSQAVNSMVLMDILEQTNEEKKQDCVQLMTLHSAKGLEFPFVFMVGLEEEILPHRTSIEEDAIEEERRLMYVGVTRAKRNLVLSLTRQRKRYSEIIATVPSRFLNELPPECVVWEGKEWAKTEESRAQQGKKHLDMIRGLLG